MLTESSGFESEVLGGLDISSQIHHGRDALTAADVARAYEQYVKSLWGGAAPAPAFCSWPEPYWSTVLPPIPAATPAAVSPHAAGGRGICWYDTATGVVGYVDGMKSGYQIPLNASIPPQPA